MGEPQVRNVSVIGLGKLGASMAAGMASRGFNVIGVDINESAVQTLNEGKAPVQETGLAEMIAKNRERIRATTSTDEAILGSDISFVIVPTPSNEKGAFSLQYAVHAFRALGRALRKKNDYHVIVLTSTVLPGSTRHGLLPVLEAESGKKCGPDFGLCYSPEFIALGSVIRDFLNPDFYLVGEFDSRSGDRLESVNRQVCLNEAPSKRMSLENAELAKVAVNSFVTVKISFANLLADLCERIPGGNVDIVTDAIGMDKRIGNCYLKGGLGFGGPCFPRDNVALAYIANQIGNQAELLQVNDRFNRSLSPRLVEKLKGVIRPGMTVAVLGLAYKPFSHVIEESPGVYLCRALSDAGYRVLGYDPLAGSAARTALQYSAVVSDSIEDCLREAHAVLVTTPDPAFKALSTEALLGKKDGVTVVDFWRCLDAKVVNSPGVRYYPMGVCLDQKAAVQRLEELWHTAVT